MITLFKTITTKPPHYTKNNNIFAAKHKQSNGVVSLYKFNNKTFTHSIQTIKRIIISNLSIDFSSEDYALLRGPPSFNHLSTQSICPMPYVRPPMLFI